MKARVRERWALGGTGLGLVAVFESWPLLDLHIADGFHAGAGDFPGRQLIWVQAAYLGTPWLGRALFLLSGVLLLCAFWSSAGVSRRIWRRAAAVHLVMLLGIGLVVHAVFKEQWGRPRPYELQAFAGDHAYVAALRPGGGCKSNCSFVSGHAATGFGLVSMAMFSPRSRRRKWFGVALGCGLVIGLGRMVQGGHFLSDILFAGWMMWAVTVLVREGWLRTLLWRRGLSVVRASPADVTPFQTEQVRIHNTVMKASQTSLK